VNLSPAAVLRYLKVIVRFCLKIGHKIFVSPKNCLKIVLRSSVNLCPGLHLQSGAARSAGLT